jgi:hypothetical protein
LMAWISAKADQNQAPKTGQIMGEYWVKWHRLCLKSLIWTHMWFLMPFGWICGA